MKGRSELGMAWMMDYDFYVYGKDGSRGREMYTLPDYRHVSVYGPRPSPFDQFLW